MATVRSGLPLPCPAKPKEVRSQILAHPDYKTRCSPLTRWVLEHIIMGGVSQNAAENEMWEKSLWQYLYNNGVDLDFSVGDDDKIPVLERLCQHLKFHPELTN